MFKLWGLLALVALHGVSLVLAAEPTPASGEAKADEKPESKPGLPRVFKLTEQVVTGYEPQGEEGFKSLQALGIKTVVTVDGAKPDLELAHKYNMRYVHIPIGYDGIEADEAFRIARTAKELPGPIYIHCHHGRHRGPAAAALIVRAQTGCSEQETLAILTRCGTSPKYEGLFAAVKRYDPEMLKQLREKFGPLALSEPLPEVVEADTVALQMAILDRAFDRLKLLEKNEWKPLEDHPDLVAAHEALIVGEHLRTSARLWGADNGEDMFIQLKSASADAFRLNESLEAKAYKQAAEHMNILKQGCIQCHDQYRDKKKIVAP